MSAAGDRRALLAELRDLRAERDALRRLYAQARRAIVAVRDTAAKRLQDAHLRCSDLDELDTQIAAAQSEIEGYLHDLDIEEGVSRVERRGEWERAP